RLGIAILLAGAEVVHGLFECGARVDGICRRDTHAVGPAEAVAMAVGVFGEAEPHAVERDVVLEGGIAQRRPWLDFYRPVLVDKCDLRHGCTSCFLSLRFYTLEESPSAPPGNRASGSEKAVPTGSAQDGGWMMADYRTV